jgi:DNA-binding transcriptional LysR family regulator
LINVHHLELFYYVARAGGITPALRLIPYGIQQPAVSTQIARLEESLVKRLLERRPFLLTPAGRALYEQIAPFFAALSHLPDALDEETAPHLRLAASPNVLREHLPNLLKLLRDEVSGLRVTLREGHQSAIERMLEDREIDIGVGLLESKASEGIQHELLIELPMVLLLQKRAPFRTAAEVIRAAPTLTLIAPPQREQLSAQFHQQLARHGRQWPARIETSDVGLIEAYAARGFGVGLSLEAPGRVLPKGLRAVRLARFPHLPFGAIHRSELPVVAEKFLRLARARARDLRAISREDGARTRTPTGISRERRSPA